MHKRVLGIVTLVILLLLCSSTLAYVAIAGRPVKTQYLLTSGQTYMHILATNTSLKKGYILLPGNTIDASRYDAFAHKLNQDSTAYVAVLRPSFRFTSAADVKGIKRIMLDNPQVYDWVLIGHSAGASIACKYAGDVRPALVVTIGGYCKKPSADIPQIGFFGSNDSFASDKEVSNLYAKTYTLQADHMLPTNTWQNTAQQQSLAATIAQYR